MDSDHPQYVGYPINQLGFLKTPSPYNLTHTLYTWNIMEPYQIYSNITKKIQELIINWPFQVPKLKVPTILKRPM